MGNANSTLALLTSSEFKWTAEIQYMGTLGNRDEAIRFASKHGCNLIVKYEKRSGPQFDVMLDPDSRWTSEAGSGRPGPARVVEAAKSGEQKKHGLLSMFGLARRIEAASASVSQH